METPELAPEFISSSLEILLLLQGQIAKAASEVKEVLDLSQRTKGNVKEVAQLFITASGISFNDVRWD